jgi:hypothetical protein
MSTTFVCQNVYDLPEISFIGGDTKTLNFYVYNSGSAAVDITSATISWNLAYYGMATSALTKSGSPSGSPVNHFTVELGYSDTYLLSGKYIQQYTLTDLSGACFRPSQGIVYIKTGIS